MRGTLKGDGTHGARVGSDGLGTTPTHPWRAKKPNPNPSGSAGAWGRTQPAPYVIKCFDMM